MKTIHFDKPHKMDLKPWVTPAINIKNMDFLYINVHATMSIKHLRKKIKSGIQFQSCLCTRM